MPYYVLVVYRMGLVPGRARRSCCHSRCGLNQVPSYGISSSGVSNPDYREGVIRSSSASYCVEERVRSRSSG